MSYLKRIASFLTFFAFAVAAILVVCPVNSEASQNKRITSAMVSDYFKSDKHISELEKLFDKNVSTVNSGTERTLTIYEPFQIPFYSASKKSVLVYNENAWYCPAAVDGKIMVLLVFSGGNELFLSAVIYLPADLIIKLSLGDAFSLFFVEATAKNSSEYGDNGALTYAVNSSGDNFFIGRELYTNLDCIDVYGYETDTSVYKKVSRYNLISNKMKTAAKVRISMKSTGLSDGTVISFTSISDEKSKLCFNGTDEFIIRTVGKDENDQIIYSLSPKNKPKSKMKIAGSTKLYIRCEVGGTVPIYSIRSAEKTSKVLAYSPDGSKLQKWNGSDKQEWIISEL